MRLEIYSEHRSFSTSQPKEALSFSFNILKKSSNVFLIFINAGEKGALDKWGDQSREAVTVQKGGGPSFKF